LERGAWAALWQTHLRTVGDLLAGEIVYAPAYDVLWIERAEDDRYWIFALDGDERAGRQAEVVSCDLPPGKAAWPSWQRDDKGTLTCRAALGFLTSPDYVGLPPSFPVLREHGRESSAVKHLVIRLGEGVSWPLALPVDHWVSYRGSSCGGFGRYKSLDWILSGRSFTRTARDRQELDRRLEDRRGFLLDSVFVVNHNYYPPWKESTRPTVEVAVGLIREVAHALGIGGGREGRPKIFFNPSAVQVDTILRDAKHRLVFANFHNDGGCWQACPQEGRLEPIRLENYAPDQSLRHIALLSAAHCHSVADPSEAGTARSICEKLLAAGVRRTSGSIVQEDALDYFARLLFLFCDARALGLELFRCCLLSGTDFEGLLGRVNRFLREMSFPEADPNTTIE